MARKKHTCRAYVVKDVLSEPCLFLTLIGQLFHTMTVMCYSRMLLLQIAVDLSGFPPLGRVHQTLGFDILDGGARFLVTAVVMEPVVG